MQPRAFSNRLMSALTLFEILKFNEPIRSLTIGGSLCTRSHEGKRRWERGSKGKETGRDMLFVIPLTVLFALSKSWQIKRITLDGQLFD